MSDRAIERNLSANRVELACLPYGVGHADEGVCLLLKLGPYRILCDCGLQGLTPLESAPTPPWPVEPSLHPDWPADIVFCSHAHADHARSLLALHQRFPDLPIYGSEATAHLLPLNWPAAPDSETHNLCQALPWRQPIPLAPGLTAELYPAGHVPGAALVVFSYDPDPNEASPSRASRVVYTGDFLLSNSRLVEGLPLNELRELSPDVLIVEGTMGTVRHPHRRQQETHLAQRIVQLIDQGISILMPVPRIGTGQELLMLLRSHHYFTGKELDVWVEEDIAIACDAYLDIVDQLPAPVQNFAQHQPLFWDERIRPRVRRLPLPLGVTLNAKPVIVLVSKTTQLATFLKNFPPRPWQVLRPEHQKAEGLGTTITGSRLRPPQPPTGADLAGEPAPLPTETYLLSAHCDGAGTTQLIHNLRPQHVVFIHGAPHHLADLISLDELANRYHLHLPGIGKCLDFPIGDGLIQPPLPTLPDGRYSGELDEQDQATLLYLPQQLRDDPRWPQLADTGLVEVTWQGNSLVIRGIPQAEILAEQAQQRLTTAQTCSSCRHYRSHHCWNAASSLYRLKVSPNGSCPRYDPKTL